MTDLTLYEFYKVSKKELGQTLEEEARKMFATDSLRYYLKESADDFTSFSQIKGNNRHLKGTR